jgi:hypothetical protein
LRELQERNRAQGKRARGASIGAKKETAAHFNHEVSLTRAALFTETIDALNEASIHASGRQFPRVLAIV